ncbi:MAG: TraR/DksA C4-type zinc finger protein [Roseibacillus sp.]|nr:TraR/DksA C4-type zinc finger protein [Roseibacillus sp.]
MAAKKKAVKKATKKAAKKAPAKKAPAKKAPAKKAAKKVPAKKAAKKVPAKKAAPRKRVKLTNFVKKQRQRLLDLQDQLMDAMYGVQQEALRNGPSGNEASGSGMHQGDAGSDAYDRDFALNLLSKEQDALQEIQAALERIVAGVYGICGISGKKIPQARLEAIPFARLTVECQSQWEQENPHRKFRSSDATGFAAGAASTPAVSLDARA